MTTHAESLERRQMLSSRMDSSGTTLVVDGTPGDDVILVQLIKSMLVVSLNGKTAQYDAGAYGDLLIAGGEGADQIENATNLLSTILGGEGNDTLRGGDAADVFDPGAGANLIYAGKNDLVDHASVQPGVFSIGRAFGVTISHPQPGSGTTISYDPVWGIAIRLTPGDDFVQGELGYKVTLLGGDGNDRMFLWQRPGDDEPRYECRVDGEAGDDTLRAGWYEDVFAPDSVWGGPGDDVIYGNGANTPDGLDGGDGHDIQTELFDLYLPDPERNFGFRVGRSIEKLTVKAPSNGLIVLGNDQGCLIDVRAARVSVLAGAGNDTIITGDSDDCILGGAGNDLIFTGDGDDSVDGGDGNDTLVAGPGANLLRGGAGDDWLIAFADKFPDTLDGGTGFDRVLLAGESDDLLLNIERTLPAGQSRLVVEVLGR